MPKPSNELASVSNPKSFSALLVWEHVYPEDGTSLAQFKYTQNLSSTSLCLLLLLVLPAWWVS